LAPLHIAAFYNSLECFVFLLDNTSYELDISQTSAEDYHPLHYAVYGGAYEVVSYILSKKPDEARVIIAREGAKNLLYLAIKSGDHRIMKLLLDCGADPNAEAYKKADLPHECIANKQFACYELLPEVQALQGQQVIHAIAMREFDLAMHWGEM
jgi:ankyrin repeat protein